mmetsp:Transcript_31593/g.57850  ORF Transcript_31593/g.57850 Transcript_31593/m.57850 type:complete len:89 (-) Transcript_31593:10-276(-)
MGFIHSSMDSLLIISFSTELHATVSRYNYLIWDWIRSLPSVKYKSKRRNGKALEESIGMEGRHTICPSSHGRRTDFWTVRISGVEYNN